MAVARSEIWVAATIKEITGSSSSKYELWRASALLRNIRNIRIVIEIVWEKNLSFLLPTKIKEFQQNTAYLT